MTAPHEITVSANAIRQGRSCGLWGDTEARVRGLARAATPTQHNAGNLAYGPFVLHMRGAQVLSITMVGPRTPDNRAVSACKLCRGLMITRVRTTIDGKEGYASRPCPRAFDATQPLCDTLKRRQP
jgi:hypothetical protein